MKLYSVLFDSFNEAPASWRDVCPEHDLAMDLQVLQVFQRTMQSQCRVWGLMVFNEGGLAIACVALCVFRVSVINVLFCGLPLPSGSSHLRILPTVPTEAVFFEINRRMKQLAQLTKSRLIIFKEFDEIGSPLDKAFIKRGYIRGAIPPMHVLNSTYIHFDDYLRALKSTYRAQIQRSKKKLLKAGFEIISGRGTAFFDEHFDEKTYQLYVNVHRNAKHKLELFSAEFFRELARALNEEVLLTLIKKQGKTHGFVFSITRGTTHYNLYSGLDYNMNPMGDLFFNLFYHDLDHAFRAGSTSLHLGQTSDYFKSRLGTQTKKLYFYANTAPAALNRILRLFSGIIFPKVDEVQSHDVFAKILL